MSDDLRKKLWASTEWWHNDSELKQAVCDALAAKDAEIKALREQRDELLGSLEKVFTAMNDDMPVGLRKVCYEAIAKAKGET